MLLGMSSFLVTQGARAIKGKGSMDTFMLFHPDNKDRAEAFKQSRKVVSEATTFTQPRRASIQIATLASLQEGKRAGQRASVQMP